MATACGLKSVTKTSTDLELLALFDEQHTCLYSSNLSDTDFLSLDSFEEKIKLDGFEECCLLNGDGSTGLEYNEQMSFLDSREQVFLGLNAGIFGNRRGLERIDQLRSLFGQNRESITNDNDGDDDYRDDSFTKPKIYACRYCPARFYSKIVVHHHQVCHAKKWLRCPRCNKRSRSNSEFRRHMDYHHPSSRERRQVLLDFL